MFAAFATAFTLRLPIFAFSVAAPAPFFSAAVDFVHGRPGAPFGLFLGNASFLVTFLDVSSLPLLLLGVLVFTSSGHGWHPLMFETAAPAVAQPEF
jgi:hypothetical protein